jgi:hypothetical protein
VTRLFRIRPIRIRNGLHDASEIDIANAGARRGPFNLGDPQQGGKNVQ